MSRPSVLLLVPLLLAASVASAAPLVVWVDPAGGVLARATDGDAQPLSLGSGACISTPSVASTPTSHLAVWTDCASHRAVAQLLSGEGFPVGASFDVSSDAAVSPQVAFDGTVFLCAWESSAQSILAARISPAGLLLDPAPIELASALARHPALASAPAGGFLVAWEWWGNWPGDIYAARVSSSGVPSTELAVATEPGGEQSPSVAWDGEAFRVTWMKSGVETWFATLASAQVR
ncbi:MAG TPA: hypothetical protein VGR02_21025 [Thermoanaerobaculia bacterium]|jgi:hypothetical protein|nr:hypothetical protein [Thermoanaerobaculia bacterium]